LKISRYISLLYILHRSRDVKANYIFIIIFFFSQGTNTTTTGQHKIVLAFGVSPVVCKVALSAYTYSLGPR